MTVLQICLVLLSRREYTHASFSLGVTNHSGKFHDRELNSSVAERLLLQEIQFSLHAACQYSAGMTHRATLRPITLKACSVKATRGSTMSKANARRDTVTSSIFSKHRRNSSNHGLYRIARQLGSNPPAMECPVQSSLVSSVKVSLLLDLSLQCLQLNPLPHAATVGMKSRRTRTIPSVCNSCSRSGTPKE